MNEKETRMNLLVISLKLFVPIYSCCGKKELSKENESSPYTAHTVTILPALRLIPEIFVSNASRRRFQASTGTVCDLHFKNK